MPQTESDPFNMVPTNANEEMAKLRDSIPPKERCLACDGFGMVENRFVHSFGVCHQCGGTGRNNLAKSQQRT